MKRAASACALVISLLIVLSCVPAGPLTIGMMAGLSGPNSLIGVASRDAARLAVDEINATGGINGRPLELKVTDDQDDVVVGRRLVDRFVGEGIPVVLGPFMSSMVPVVEEHAATDILFFSPTISAAALLGRDDNFLRVMPASTVQGDALVDEMVRDRAERAAIIYDGSNAVFSLELARYLRERIEAHGMTVPSMLDADELGLRPIAREVATVDPDALVLMTNGYDSALLAQEIREFGAGAGIYASYWALSQDFLEHGGRAVEGATLASIMGQREATDRYLEFETSYMERYGERPDLLSSHAYEAVYVIATALRGVDDVSPVSIKEAIIDIGRFRGLWDEIVIDRYGDTRRPITLFEVRDGEFVALSR